MNRKYTYITYGCMLTRCYNSNHSSFKRYGARGIFIDERWRGPEGFDNFISDMGLRPYGATIDRINPKLGYGPFNCRWVSPKSQAANASLRRDTVSGYRGVSRARRHQTNWVARICSNYKIYNIGTFSDKIEAAKAYDVAALLAFGDFANINFPESKEQFYAITRVP